MTSKILSFYKLPTFPQIKKKKKKEGKKIEQKLEKKGLSEASIQDGMWFDGHAVSWSIRRIWGI